MTVNKNCTSIYSKKWLSSILLLLLVSAFGLYVYAEKQIDRMYGQRQDAFQLADQLRQSSMELTRMARAYVLTGDDRYQSYFQNILDIRDGKILQPEGYFYNYWDLVVGNVLPPPETDKPGVALLDRVQKTGVTATELAQLELAKTNSDQLARLEQQAMASFKSNPGDNQADQGRARAMLHDDHYHRQKVKIMQPINEFYRQFENRTSQAISTAKNMALLIRLIFIADILAAVTMLWRAYSALLHTLGATATELHGLMQRIGSGDLSEDIGVGEAMAGSVLAGLATMQQRLRTLEMERMRANDELRLHHHALGSISQGVVIANSKRSVIDINPAFEHISGYNKAEIYGKSCNVLQGPDTDPNTVAELKSRLDAGLPFNSEILNYRKDGTPFWNELAITPVFDSAGQLSQFVGVQRDITERKLAMQYGHARNRALEQLAQGAALTDILATLITSIELEHPVCLCSILLLDEAKTHLLMAAAPSLPDDYNRAVDGLAIGPCAGSCGTAAFLGEPVIVEDIAQSPLWANFSGLALSHGLKACWSHPIKTPSGEVLGTFAVYYRETLKPNCIALEMIANAATIACSAIEYIRVQQALRIAAITFETQEGIIVTNSNKEILRINQAFTRIFGYTIAEVIGSTPSILKSNHAEDKFYTALWKRLLREHHWSGEIWDRRKNGQIFPAWLTITAVTDDEGVITHYVGIFSDITDQKNIQELQNHRDYLQELVNERTNSLYESEQRYRLLVDGVKDCANLMLDPRGYIITWNQGAEQLTGYCSEDIVGQHFSIFYSADAIAAGKPETELSDANNRGRVEDEVWHKRKDGEYFWAHLVITALYNDQNELQGFSSVTRDGTEQKFAEDMLRDSSARIQTIFDTVMEGIITIDEQGNIETLNPAAENIFGYSAAEVIGKNINMLMPWP